MYTYYDFEQYLVIGLSNFWYWQYRIIDTHTGGDNFLHEITPSAA